MSGLAAQAAVNGRVYGAALQWSHMSDSAYAELVERELAGGKLVHENHLKWGFIEPTQGTRVYTQADPLVAWGKARTIATRGHTLFDPFRNPSWLANVVNSNNWHALLDAHIQDAMTHTGTGVDYAEDILDWDVCNEVFGEGDNNGVFVESGGFYAAAGGSDYIPYCFERARVHNQGARLVLNCNDIDDNRASVRRGNVLEWLSDWLSQGVPIDAVGIQGHMRPFFTTEASRIELKEFIRDIKGLGLEVIVTEFDITTGDIQGDTIAARKDGVLLFANDALKLFLEEGIEEVITWGLTYDKWFKSSTNSLSGVPFSASPYVEEPVHQALVEQFALTSEGLVTMTFPFSFHANFETGSKDAFDSESDSGNRLDFPGPQQLARDMLAVFPHRGAYCARVNLGKNTTTAYLEEDVTWAADATNHIRFELMVGEDVQVGNDGDLVDVMVLRSASADEGALSLSRIEPAGLVLGLRDASGTILHYLSVKPGVWNCVEVQVDVDAGGGNDGSIIVNMGDDQIRLSGLDQEALTGVRFGAMNQDGDFTGHIYFDEIVFDTARLYPDYSPNNMRLDGETMPVFKSGWVFVGEGEVLGCTLVRGTEDATLKVYDTDELSFSEHMLKEVLKATTSVPVAQSQPIGDSSPLFKVMRGCYVQVTGAEAYALVRLGQVDEFDFDEDAQAA